MNIYRNNHGSALLPFVIVLPFLILIIGYYVALSTNSYRLAKNDQSRTRAQLATDAGIDIALKEINADESWAGSGGEVEFYTGSNTRVTYQTTVTDNGEDSKTITSTGRTFWPANKSTPEATVKISVSLRPVKSGSFSIGTGVGGLYMSNSAKILGGDVFVNGEVRMSNTAQIGLSTNPINLTVAHQNCPSPANADYPRLCNPAENGQPITISSPAKIYGNVRANNQTSTDHMESPGLTDSSGVTPQALPTHDRAAQKAAIATEITGAAASCSGNTTRTWPANVKITGNVVIRNKCKVTAEGDVWITGTLTIQNSESVIRPSDSLGTTRPNIMIDGSGVAFTISNGGELGSNSSNTGFQAITYWSAASCSPECASVTGTDLYNSRDTTTISTQNQSDAPHSILYAKWSRVAAGNSGEIGALIGQTVQLSNSATITFGTSISTDGNSFWIIDNYRRTYD